MALDSIRLVRGTANAAEVQQVLKNTSNRTSADEAVCLFLATNIDQHNAVQHNEIIS